MGKIAPEQEEKIGAIKLTKSHKVAITKLLELPEWEYVEDWFRQRQTNIATGGISVSQDALDLHHYKGRVAESRHSILSLRKIADDYRKSEKKDS